MKCHKKKKKGINLREKNGMWKGERVSYKSLHQWVRNNLKKPNMCPVCKEKPPYDVVSKKHKYIRDLRTWKWLCRKCHMELEGRLQKLQRGNKNGKYLTCPICKIKFYVHAKATYFRKYCSHSCANKGRLLCYAQNAEQRW